MLLLWGLVFLLSIGVIAAFLPSALTTDSTVTNDPESQQGYAVMNERIRQHEPGDFVNELVIVRAPGRDVTNRSGGAESGRRPRLGARGDARDAVDPHLLRGPAIATLVSPDKDATVLAIGMGPDAEEGIKRRDRGRSSGWMRGRSRRRSRASSRPTRTSSTISNKDLKEGELFFGLPASLLVLLLVFGAVVASLVPLLLAIVAITVALALVALRGPGLGALVLRRQHADRDGARARGRLLALHRLSLPRGARRRVAPSRRRSRRRDGRRAERSSSAARPS